MANSSALDWTSLRDFLAVAEAGSLSAAARRLGVSQPTLTRRMAALEERLRADLFRRTPRGLELTEAGEAALVPARRMEHEAHALDLAVSGRDTALSGLVRITTTEGLGIYWLTPTLAELQTLHPAIQVEALIQSQTLNLLRREADIAVRLGRPRQSDLVARRVGDLVFGLYASLEYLERHGRPEREDLHRHRAVAFDEEYAQVRPGSWLEKMLSPARVVYRSNSVHAQLAAVRAGYGIGGLTRFFADPDASLERVLPDAETRLELWLVTHAGLRRSARIRAVFDFLAERLEEARERFDPPRNTGGR